MVQGMIIHPLCLLRLHDYQGVGWGPDEASFVCLRCGDTIKVFKNKSSDHVIAKGKRLRE